MSEWTVEDPGLGEMAGLGEIARNLRTSAHHVRGMRVILAGFGSDIALAWSGDEAFAAWEVNYVAECRRFDTVAQDFDAVAGRVEEYVGEVERIKGLVAGYRGDLADLTARARGEQVTVVFIPAQSGGRYQCVPPVTSGRVLSTATSVETGAASAARTRELEGALNAKLGQVHGLASVRRVADERMSRVMADVAPAWGQVRAVFGAAGVAPGRMDPARLPVVLAGRVGAAMAAGEPIPAVIVEYMDAHRSDTDLWAKFYGSLPPERVVAYGVALGAGEVDAGAIDSFNVLRDGLAAYGLTLPGDAQSQLGRSLTRAAEAGMAGGGSVILASILAADGMPVRVCAGAAVEIDRIERVDGPTPQAWLRPDGEGVRWLTGADRPGPGLVSPSLIDHPEVFTGDPMAEAMKGLARDPRCALDFFNPAGGMGEDGADRVADARIEFWLGERSYRDGGQAVTAALAAATGYGANMAEGSGRPERAAYTISAAAEALGTNDELGEFTATAGASIARAFDPWMADLYRYGEQATANSYEDEIAESGRSDPDAGWGDPVVGETRLGAVLDPDAMRTILAATGADHGVAAQWSAQATTYAETAVQRIMEAPDSDDKLLHLSDSLTSVAETCGFVDGGLVKGELDRAQSQDEATEWLITVGKESAGRFPGPAGLIGGGVATGVNAAQQAGLVDFSTRYDEAYEHNDGVLKAQGRDMIVTFGNVGERMGRTVMPGEGASWQEKCYAADGWLSEELAVMPESENGSSSALDLLWSGYTKAFGQGAGTATVFDNSALEY